MEAEAVADIVEALIHLNARSEKSLNLSKHLGIIVPFRNQIAMIAHELAALDIEGTEAITIDTVERYQGSQRDIIIYSTTVSQPYQLDILSVTTQADGQLIDHKLNVALTRARKQLFIVGNAHLLCQNEIYRKLVESINRD